MKKLFKIILIFFIILYNFSIINFAETNKINEVVITINIKNDSSAEITEIWDADIYLGTELYRSFENKYLDKIYDFNVYEDGKKYEKNDEWDIARKFKK